MMGNCAISVIAGALACATAQAELPMGNEFTDEFGFSISRPDHWVWVDVPSYPHVFLVEDQNHQTMGPGQNLIAMYLTITRDISQPTVHVVRWPLAENSASVPLRQLAWEIKRDDQRDLKFELRVPPTAMEIAGAPGAHMEYVAMEKNRKGYEQMHHWQEWTLIHSGYLYEITMVSVDSADRFTMAHLFNNILKSIRLSR